jgi:hypothetical protein
MSSIPRSTTGKLQDKNQILDLRSINFSTYNGMNYEDLTNTNSTFLLYSIVNLSHKFVRNV